MPWTKEDAEEHKKGMTDAQKKRWASIANSVLADCTAADGDVSDCEAKAIRIANAKATQPATQLKGNMSELIRWEVKGNKPYCVAPVVMMPEGVANGLLYPAEELEKFPEAWDNRPVPILHPKKDGKNVSANTPETSLGAAAHLFNTKFEDGKLKSEIWINPDEADAIDPVVMQKLKNNETMEVSTGLYIEIEETPGEFNGVAYTGIARNHRPDHLALLPNGGAACSWDAGAGVPRTNEQEETDVEDGKDPSVFARFGHWVADKFKTHELNHNEIDDHLRTAIKAKLNLNKNEWVWMKEVFDTYCIYTHEIGDGITRLYKQSYVIDNEDHVLLADDAVEVKEVTSYPLVSPEANISSNKGDPSMDDKEKKEQVEALIANEKSDYTEEDRKELEALSEKTLTNLAGTIAVNEEEAKKQEEEAAEKKKEEEDAAAAAAAEAAGNQAPETLSKEEVKTLIADGVKAGLEAKSKVPILDRLKANEDCKVSDEGLTAMSQEDLEALEQSLSPEDYIGQGGPRNHADDEQPDPPPEMDWSARRKSEGLE